MKKHGKRFDNTASPTKAPKLVSPDELAHVVGGTSGGAHGGSGGTT